MMPYLLVAFGRAPAPAVSTLVGPDACGDVRLP